MERRRGKCSGEKDHEKRKGKCSGEKDHEKRKGSRTTPTAPAAPDRAGEGLPSLLAAVRCARAALMLSYLRSPSPSTSLPTEGGSTRDLEGAFAAAEADPDVEAALAGVTRQMERLLRVVWIEAGLQVVFVFVLCALVLLLEVASPPPSGYYD